MADEKISQMPGASLPLDGTELVPLVQLGANVQTPVSNLPGGGGAGITELTGAISAGPGSGSQASKLNADFAAISVFQYGAVGDGVTDDTAAFTAAAAANAFVYVPPGNFLLNAATGTGFWYLAAGANILGLPPVGGGHKVQDTSRLTGQMIKLGETADIFLRAGDTTPWVETDVRLATQSISGVQGISATGQIGILGASRTSDDPTVNMACIGIAAYALNDNPAAEPAWAHYAEALRPTANNGATYANESDISNFGDVVNLTPYTDISATHQSVAHWVASGGGHAGVTNATAAMVVLPNGAEFQRGLLFLSGALDATISEAVTLANTHRLAWYDANGLTGYQSGEGLICTRYSDVQTDRFLQQFYRRKATLANATTSGDIIQRSDYFGWTGAVPYEGGFIQCLQRTNFTGGNARFSMDISAKNAAGADVQVTLNGITDSAFTPFPSNTLSLGSASALWTVVYATTGTINTSDARQKTEEGDISDALKTAVRSIKIRQFKWNDAIEAKGDKARIHFGVFAQDVAAAFEAQGLDPHAYGLFCEDAITNEAGELTGEIRMGVRYDELMALKISAAGL